MEQVRATQHGGQSNPLDDTGLCLLSLDGGGVRGLSTLYILKSLMSKLAHERYGNAAGTHPPVKPCEVFDLIGGTSTGGLIAIMLGRLEMTVDECISAYRELIKAVFEEKDSRFGLGKTGNIKAQFSSKTLESAIKGVLASREGVSEGDLLDDGKARGFVCATAHETKGISRLRSYSLPGELGNQTPPTICEAALATSAATRFFDPVKIGTRTFVDGALGANNPVVEMEDEAARIWCPDTAELKPLVKCFVSIGTGNPGKAPIEEKVWNFLSKTLVDLVTETEKTANEFASRWKGHLPAKRYFRFNVQHGLKDIGLAEYQKEGAMEAATVEYLEEAEQYFRVQDCARNLKQKQNRTETSFASVIREYETRCVIQSQTTVNKACWNVPFGRNWQFVGQASHLNRLENALFTERQPPKIAITGLGGVGKTQIVLELAYCTKEKHQDCSVFWLPATNAESLQQAFKDIGQQLEVPGIEDKQADVKKLVQRRLSQESAGQWLLIVDNVDDIEIWNHELKAYLPKSKQGYVVCTTRNRRVAVKIAAANVIEVAEMDEEMAMQLLTKSLINQELLNSHQDAQKLLEQLTFLPLAIVQAAAYVNENGIALSEYLVLLEEQEQDVIDLLSEDFDDDGRYEDVKNPVATTWLVSFEHIRRLDPLAAEYLSFMSCIDPKGIPQSLLPPAQSRKKETDAIGTLDAYSFVSKRAADEALDVHRLVHLAMRNWLRTNNEWLVWADKTLERLVEVIYPDGHGNKKVRKACLPHAHYIVGCTAEEKQIGKRTYLLGHMAVCLKVEGRYNEASNAFSLLVKALQQVLGEEHPKTLENMGNLAGTYRDQGRWKDAEVLFLQVLEAKTRVLGDKDHPSVLTTRDNLAITYYMQGRFKEAEELQLQVLETRLRVLGNEHPSTLIIMGNLAESYCRQGRWKEAEDLQVQLMETGSRVFGDEHPKMLLIMANMAFILRAQNRNTMAISLMEECVQLRERIPGDHHPDTETLHAALIRWTTEDMELLT
ncbi:unnamed protein product [Alternaria alternata]